MKQEGNSGSGEQRNDLQELIKEIAVNGWTPVTSLVEPGTRNMTNEKWGGHYYYNISGGQQNALQSWEGKKLHSFLLLIKILRRIKILQIM